MELTGALNGTDHMRSAPVGRGSGEIPAKVNGERGEDGGGRAGINCYFIESHLRLQGIGKGKRAVSEQGPEDDKCGDLEAEGGYATYRHRKETRGRRYN